jgi:hypothetical protein
MQESRTIAFYLVTDSLSSFDLRAAEAAMADADFEVTLHCDDGSNALKVAWQPDPILHPEFQAGGILGRPPMERRTLRFDAGEPARQVRSDIAALLRQDEQAVPAALTADGPVHLMELKPASAPRHEVAMLYALLVDLVATTRSTGTTLIYDPGSALYLKPENVRELMSWRDFLTQLDNPLDTGTSDGIEDPDFAPSGESDHGQAPASAPSWNRHSAAPGTQQASHTWAWLLGGLAAAGLIAWTWLGD